MKENCKDNKHCWVNMKNAMADHSDCDTCCDCGVAFVNLYHKETIEIPRIQVPIKGYMVTFMGVEKFMPEKEARELASKFNIEL